MKPLSRYFRPDVRKRQAYHLTPHPEAIKLNQNELPYDLPESLKKKLLKRLGALPLNRYPQTQPARLRERLAKKLSVSPEQLLFSNGSNVMIQALVMSCAVDSCVMVVNPTFGVYQSEIELFRNRVVAVPLEKDSFGLPRKVFLQKMRRYAPPLIFLPNPNAPTGNLFLREDLLTIVREAPGLVVVDEAYCQFTGETLLPELGKYPNLILLRTFSKGFGLGGVRIGYLIAHPEIVAEVEKVLMPYCVSSVSEEIALFVLDHEDHFQEKIREVLSERDRLAKRMQKLEGIQTFRSDANFLLFRVADAKACFDYLVKHHILIRNVSSGPGLERCLRVSVGSPEENDLFLKVLKRFLAK